jgi:restriction endonuclease S subunit
MSRKQNNSFGIQIPKKELKSLVKQVKRGLSSYYVQAEGNEVRFINIRNVSDGRIDYNDVECIKIKETDALAKSRLQPNDVVLTAKGSLFKAGIATDDSKGFVISSNLIAFTLNEEILPELVVAYLNSPVGQTQLQAVSVGAAQKALNTKALMELKIPVPPIAQQKIVAEYLQLSSDYDNLMKKEQELRKKINNSIIQTQMQG